jgi:endonuclease/exonuclease/phosphatase (EEP) superfamily protein YafD
MKTLTIISAFFMPISFVVGFFGMNFSGLPFNSPWLLASALGMIVMTPLLMLYWFGRRGWLSPSETRSWRNMLASETTSEASLSQGHWEEEASQKSLRDQLNRRDKNGGNL